MICRDLPVATLLFLIAFIARAETVVTACGTDNAVGGTNLATALAAGGDIRIRCSGGGNQIKLTSAHALSRATTIEGGNVTLIGPGQGAMFSLDGAQPLTLRNLAVKHPPSTPADPTLFTGIVYDTSDTAVVEVDRVRVTETRLPFAVRRFIARDSAFIGNGAVKNPDFGVVMAGDLELDNVTFSDNLSRPFQALWRDDTFAKNKKIVARVRKSVFERNRRPALWVLGDLSVESSRFVGNGDVAPFVRGVDGDRYVGAGFFNPPPSWAGAVDILGVRATISRSTFEGNRGGLGGAVFAWQSALTLQSSSLDANHAVHGGAVAYLSLRNNPLFSPGFTLSHVKLRRNQALKSGGALVLSGKVSGDGVLISGNAAGDSGGALAVIRSSNPNSTMVELMRTFVLDNSAAQHAVDAGTGVLRLGNALLARNVATGTGGAAISAQNAELANSSLIGNQSAGLRIEAGGAEGTRVANVILADNLSNCTGALAALRSDGPNLQHPGAGCGLSITVANPSLDSRFAPTLLSPARGGGSATICVTHDLVAGRDLYGEARSGARCSIGAVESNPVHRIVSKVGPNNVRCLLLFVLAFLVICFIVAFVAGVRRRRASDRT